MGDELLLAADSVPQLVMGVYRPHRPDIHQVSVLTVGVDGTEQCAAGVGDDVFSRRCGISSYATGREQRHH